ncbi:MAG: c-type cytochrome [Planctomycetota bacterium]
MRVLAVPAILVAATLASCGDDTKASGGGSNGPTAALTAAQRSEMNQLYSAKQCVMCHPADGSGSQLGPGLTGIEEDWNEADLTAFLLDPPGGVAASARLTDLASGYQMHMPKPAITAEQAALMARWLLAGRPQ